MTHPIGVVTTALKLLCIMCLLQPTLVAAENISTASLTTASDSIHWIVLPYLHASHENNKQQLTLLHQDKSAQHLSHYNWIVLITSMSDFNTRRDNLQALDPYQSMDARLATDHHSIIIPIPEQTSILLPLQTSNPLSTPLWLQYVKAGKTTWHTPHLTPKVATQVRAEQQRTERMAERMAERAFYFGYDTNDDALE